MTTIEILRQAVAGEIENRFETATYRVSTEILWLGTGEDPPVVYAETQDDGTRREFVDHHSKKYLGVWTHVPTPQPEVILEWSWDMYEYRVVDGELQMLGADGEWGRVAMFPAQHLAQSYASLHSSLKAQIDDFDTVSDLLLEANRKLEALEQEREKIEELRELATHCDWKTLEARIGGVDWSCTVRLIKGMQALSPYPREEQRP